ncbi:MAG: hypothetical protein QS748_14925, partial [Candidatus Endonucleobacter bathymodioli]|nr:hypothetical protein [Candidatus Endonucleobacter bathymodioli]
MGGLMYIAFSFVTFLYFNIYIFDNVKIMNGGSVSLLLLAICFCLSFYLILYQAIKSNKIHIRKSTLLLVLFYIYVLIRITIDTKNIEMFKSYLFSTSGGMITFYVLGL